MRKIIFQSSILILLVFSLSGCGFFNFGQDNGPDSGEEIDINEPTSPDSGEEIDVNEPTSPDSGEEIDINEPTSPDSGEEINIDEPDSPDSGEEIDLNEPTSPDSGEEIDINEPTSPDSGEEISISDYYKGKAKGSCDAIASASTCAEYIGSFWTWENIKLNCSGSGIPSKKPCPRPALGGCNLGGETPNEIITWHYSYGDGGFDSENIQYAAAACNALAVGKWIY